MKKLTIAAMFVMVSSYASADQAVYIDQVSGENLNLTITQQNGDGNSVGQPQEVNPYFTIEGDDQTIDILQNGGNNLFFGSLQGDTIGFDLDMIGDDNTVDMETSNASNSDYVLSITGSNNSFDLDFGQTISSEYTDLDYNIIGGTNTFTTVIDSDGATQDISIDGDSNNYNITQNGFGSSLEGHAINVTSIGSFNSVDFLQETTIEKSTIDMVLNGSNQVVDITQSD